MAVIPLILVVLAAFSHGFLALRHQIYFVGGALVVALLLILSESRTSIDLATRTVSWSKGVWPIILRGQCSLDACVGFEVNRIYGGKRRTYRLSLVGVGGRILIDQSSYYPSIAERARGLSMATGIPLHDDGPGRFFGLL